MWYYIIIREGENNGGKGPPHTPPTQTPREGKLLKVSNSDLSTTATVVALQSALDEFITMEGIVEITGLYPMYCRREVKDAGLPYVELGGVHLYLRSAVNEWVKARAKAKQAREEKSKARRSA